MRGAIEPKLRWHQHCLLLLFFLQGCAIPETQLTHIRVEPAHLLPSYHVFEVEKVTNDTGKTFSFDISSFFADELESALRKKGYEIAEPGKAPAKALRMTCSIVSYSPSTAGQKAEATALGFVPGGFYFKPENTAVVKATLVDQQTGKMMADLISSKSQTETGVIPPISIRLRGAYRFAHVRGEARSEVCCLGPGLEDRRENQAELGRIGFRRIVEMRPTMAISASPCWRCDRASADDAR